MSPRPDPAGTKNTDERESKRFWQSWLRPPYALDEQEQRRQMSEGSTDNGARVARAAMLEQWQRDHGTQHIVGQAGIEAMDRAMKGDGPRPVFMWPAPAGGYLTPEEQSARAAELDAQRKREPQPDPTEPGRYVQPSGRFALAESEGFEPDSR